MPDVLWDRVTWAENYRWDKDGDEWSMEWCGARSQADRQESIALLPFARKAHLSIAHTNGSTYEFVIDMRLARQYQSPQRLCLMHGYQSAHAILAYER